MRDAFKQHIRDGYGFEGESFILGGAMLDGEAVPEATVRIPLKTLNRHGLIAGATGTGKTKTLQIIAEQLSTNGVPCLLMDVKGDLSGLAAPGANNDHITWRHGQIGIPYEPEALPVELLTLSDEPGVRLRATVSEFGPVLLAKILDLNDTQAGVLALVFQFCDDNKLPLVDLDDLKRVLQFTIGEGKEDVTAEYGSVHSASVNAIMRKMIVLEQQGAEAFFGEPSFDVNDLVRTDDRGRGMLSIIRLTDIQHRPKLFSTFMLSLLGEIFAEFPEQGDADKPKLCLFIDEAHLLFDEASKPLLDQIETTVKLIRSKGVGVFFITQDPTDIPDDVLGQLGLKVQHALRAFTAKDRDNIRKTAANYPLSDFYDTETVLTELGIGEAFITALNEKGIPTPLAATLLRAPKSRMDVLTQAEIDALVKRSDLVPAYAETVDGRTAHEILQEKLEKTAKDAPEEVKKAAKPRKRRKKEEGFIEELSKNTMFRQLGRTVMREITRGLLGKMGVK